MSTKTDTRPRTFGPAIALFFRQASPLLLTALSLIAIGWRLSLGAWSAWDALIPLLWWAAWPFQEWLIHVFILHFEPRTILGFRIDPANARKHRAHHADPTAVSLVFIPLHSIATSLPLLIGLSVLLLPTPLAATSIAAFVLQSLHYEWSHYLAHVPYTPGLRYYQRICHKHTLHHYRNEQHWFGVSRTLADAVLGTDPDVASTPLSPTVRTLGITE